MVVAAVDAEVVEPVSLRQAIQPILLRYFVAGIVLRRPRLHHVQLRQRRAAYRSVAGAVLLDQLLEQIRPFQHDAAARRRLRQRAEVAEELRVQELLTQGPWVVRGVDRLLRELHDRARLDVAPRVDVVTDAGRRRTESLTLAVEIGVDDDDRLPGAHLDDETP